ncbi:MAG: cupin domain-containing protein [Bacteroidales bacterium]
MISRNYKSEEIRENPHKVDVRQMYNNASAQVMHVTLRPGESLKPHKTPVDVVFYVLEGTPLIQVGNESKEFEKDTLIESPAEIVHCISNLSKNDTRVLVIKAPRPDVTAKFV